MVFQCADGVVLIWVFVTENCMDTDRQHWPDIQRRLHVSFGIASKAQIEIAGECKDDVSPSSTYVYELMPQP